MCRTYLVAGNYPRQLLKLWDSYAKTGKSQNDRPGLLILYVKKYCRSRKRVIGPALRISCADAV